MKEIHHHYAALQEEIKKVHKQTADVLLKQRQDKMTTLDRKLDEIKGQLKAQQNKKQENNYDFKQREKELNEHLDTMTQIAQRIDDENRALMKKNAELKIEYLSQENDRDLLLTQLLQQKKEHQRLKILAEEVKNKALSSGIPRPLIE